MKTLVYFYSCLTGGLAMTTVRRMIQLKRYFRVRFLIPFFDSANDPHNLLYNELIDNNIPVDNLFNVPGQGENLLLIQQTARDYFANNPVDIAIIPATTPACQTVARTARENKNTLVVSELRLPLELLVNDASVISYLHKVPHAIFPNSQHGADTLQDILPQKTSAAVVNGVTIPEPAPHHKSANGGNPFKPYINGGDIVITNIAQLHFQKNHVMFIRAIADLAETHPHVKAFIIGGDASMGTYIKKFAREHNLDRNIIFLGYRDDIESLLDYTHIFCLTSYWEGMPKSLLEAMAKGLPVVACASPGIDEIITHRRDGFKVQPNDHKSLARQLGQLTDSPFQRSETGENARETIMNKYHLPTVCQYYADTLNHLHHNIHTLQDHAPLPPIFQSIENREPGQSAEILQSPLLDSLPVLRFNLCLQVLAAHPTLSPQPRDTVYRHLQHLVQQPWVAGYLWQMGDQDIIKNAAMAAHILEGPPLLRDILRDVLDYPFAKEKHLLMYAAASTLEQNLFYSQALTLFQELEASAPLSRDLRGGVSFHKARIFYRLRQPRQAHECLKRTLELIPNHNAAANMLTQIKLTA